jgi:F-type H+-transporting ATPase subunit c
MGTLRGIDKERVMKKLLGIVTSFVLVLLTAGVALAQEGSVNVLAQEHGGLMAIAVAIGIGIAAFGGAFGQGRAASAALEGISRNPNASDKVFVPMILGLAFIESLVLFTWVLMFLLLGKL